jgi:hypothetical protein
MSAAVHLLPAVPLLPPTCLDPLPVACCKQSLSQSFPAASLARAACNLQGLMKAPAAAAAAEVQEGRCLPLLGCWRCVWHCCCPHQRHSPSPKQLVVQGALEGPQQGNPASLLLAQQQLQQRACPLPPPRCSGCWFCASWLPGWPRMQLALQLLCWRGPWRLCCGCPYLMPLALPLLPQP